METKNIYNSFRKTCIKFVTWKLQNADKENTRALNTWRDVVFVDQETLHTKISVGFPVDIDSWWVLHSYNFLFWRILYKWNYWTCNHWHWLLSLTVMTLGFIHVVVSILLLSSNSLYVVHKMFIHLPTESHLGCFLVWAIIEYLCVGFYGNITIHISRLNTRSGVGRQCVATKGMCSVDVMEMFCILIVVSIKVTPSLLDYGVIHQP